VPPILEHVDPAVVRRLPEHLARRYAVVPVAVEGRTLVIATATPEDLDLEQTLAFAAGTAVRLVVADPGQIVARLDDVYAVHESLAREAASVLESLGDAVVDATVLDGDLATKLGDDDADPTGIVRRIAATILGDAVTRGVSDVHITHADTGGSVRYRIDGVMEQVLALPSNVYARVLSRLKVIAGLDISDRLRPQDGRARIVVYGRAIDLRVSTLPVQGAHERMVIRVLSDTIIQSLDTMDMAEPERSQLMGLMTQADGLILLTGPTGSGKTTTLHAALKQRLSPDVTIMTVENPVEYKIEGVSQIQVEPKQGVTFSSVLRAMLRQDPDILLVGEIRDTETAEVAAQAAMTGHLVLSTVHADDAPNALLRLQDLGLDAETLGEAFRGAASQRLLRRLCTSCKRAANSTAVSDDDARLRSLVGASSGAHAVGCDECRGTGYRGRIPIHQVFVVTPALRTMIRQGADLASLRTAAAAAGMRTLSASATTRIIAGDTTIDEAVRVLGARFWEELAVGAALATPVTAEHETPLEATGTGAPRPSVALSTAAALTEVAALLVNEPAATTAAVTDASVAVLPFINMSADAAQDYFADGITEDIITALSPVRGLRVAAHASSFAFKGQRPDVETMGRALRVAHVLEGSVRTVGPRVRIAVQLMSVADGAQRWAARFDRTLDDIFAVQDEIAEAVTQQLRTLLLPTAAPAAPTPALLASRSDASITAYQFFLRGRAACHQRTAAGFRHAIELFERALVEAPDYARAHAGLAEAYIGMGSYFVAPFAESSARAADALQRAGGTASPLAIVHALTAQRKLYLGPQWRSANSDLERALAIDPDLPLALALRATWFGMLGDYASCRVAAERAIAADPLAPHVRALAVATFPHHGPPGCDAAAALAAHEAALALEQHSVSNLWMSAVRLGDLGEYRAAEERLQWVDSLSRGAPLVSGLRVRLLAQQGRVDEARALRAALVTRASSEFVPPGLLLIGGLLSSDDEDATADLLRRAVDDATGPIATFTVLRAQLDPLLAHPRLGALVRELSLYR
jgi:type IV pilus assembly protein PilB